MGEGHEQRFKVGETVQRINQPDAVGVIRRARWSGQTCEWEYQVQFGATLKTVPGSVLQCFEAIFNPWDLFHGGSYSGIGHLVFTLTWHRLNNPPSRIARSFATTKTIFYPHQFKPLLKFLDNPQKRILIADDVGLGKTIEAGYILRELEAHEPVERALIIAPARLLPKWKRELQERFGETFEIIKGADLLAQASRIRRGQTPDEFRWIISYESVRPDEVREALAATELPIDLLVCDEAHRMRNPDTLQHRVGAALCRGSADAVAFLTATPVQNTLEDLWHLFRLLSPEEFAQWPVFEQQMEANRLLLEIQNTLREVPPDLGRARSLFQAFTLSPSGRVVARGVLWNTLWERLSQPTIARNDIVEIQGDLGRLSPIGHILSRTRKVEAITSRAVRSAQWQSVELTEDEREIYDGMEQLCREAWRGNPAAWGFQMSLQMAYRMTASCIPAAIRYFAERLEDKESASLMFAEVDDEDDNRSEGSSWTPSVRTCFSRLVEDYRRSSKVDSKLQAFHQALTLIWQEDDASRRPRRKIVVFSFFRRTLAYLHKQLLKRSIACQLIHGGIGIADREVAIEEFLESEHSRILLASEVGGEGLDLQKASVVINYDLPWNPMVVEQRVGRIDRIGQESDRIVILNLVVKNSIEERVIQRLIDKIEVFKNSIGELDDIVGDQIEQLTARALRGELLGEELDRVVEAQGNAMANRLKEARDVLSKVDSLLAADQALIDEIRAVMGERQIPGERELWQFLNRYIAKQVQGCQLPMDVVKRVVQVDLQPLMTVASVAFAELSGEAKRFALGCSTGLVSLTLSREAAMNHPRAEYVHMHHPLVEAAVKNFNQQGLQGSASFCVAVRTDELPAGWYAFLISAVHLKGHRSRIRLVTIFTDVVSGRIWTEQETTTPVVLKVLEEGSDVDSPQFSSLGLESAQERLLSGLGELKSTWQAREAKLDVGRREQMRASRRATLDFLTHRAEERVESLQKKGAGAFAVRMAQLRLDRAKAEAHTAAEQNSQEAIVNVEHEELAIGLLKVVGG